MSRRADYAGRVGFVHHNQSVVLLSQFANLIHRSYIAVHREDTVRSDDAVALCLGFLQATFQVGHVCVGIAIAFSLAETYTVDDGSMVQRVGNDRVFFCKERFEQTTVGIEASSIEDSIFSLEVIRDSSLELLVQVLCSADEADGRHAVTVRIHRLFRCLNQALVVCQAQVVVCAEVQYLVSGIHLDVGALRSCDDSFVLVKSGFLNIL